MRQPVWLIANMKHNIYYQTLVSVGEKNSFPVDPLGAPAAGVPTRLGIGRSATPKKFQTRIIYVIKPFDNTTKRKEEKNFQKKFDTQNKQVLVLPQVKNAQYENLRRGRPTRMEGTTQDQ